MSAVLRASKDVYFSDESVSERFQKKGNEHVRCPLGETENHMSAIVRFSQLRAVFISG